MSSNLLAGANAQRRLSTGRFVAALKTSDLSKNTKPGATSKPLSRKVLSGDSDPSDEFRTPHPPGDGDGAHNLHGQAAGESSEPRSPIFQPSPEVVRLQIAHSEQVDALQ